MRFFKANEPLQSEEDKARDLRLTAIASRYRVREVGDPPQGGPVELGKLGQ
jgi:hypothetical protein